MHLFRVSAVIAVVVSCASAGLAAGPDWRLAWEDDFDRTELGGEWRVDSGAAVVDGGLRLEGRVWARTVRGFEPDVRLEFDARALPGVPPCDLSATLASSEELGWGYLLGFGARGNRANHLLGPGVHFVDHDPPFVIEHGKNYHLVAQKEGRRITYSVNGQTIIDVTTDDPLGGQHFDKVGIITWTGMFVDNVRVYERATPHPDTPLLAVELPDGPLYREGRALKIRAEASSQRLRTAVDAFNGGKFADALGRFRAMGDTAVGLLGQAYVLGDLDYLEPFHNPGFERLAREFHLVATAHPEDEVLADYAVAAGWFARLKMRRSSAALASALRIRALGPQNNPFYYTARLYQARYRYWDGKEGGKSNLVAEAVGWMQELRTLWPANIILRQYCGEKVLWGEELIADTERHPAWAAHLREAYARNIAIMRRFIEERQSPDGQLGGGYGDDVELLRTWMQIAAISSAAEPVCRGIEHLCEGVWNNVLVKGYDRSLSDVEHSAEPSADTLPAMLFLRYGDPLWVERNLRSCNTIKKYYMGLDRKGYPRFRSSGFGNLQVDTTLLGGGDTGYCARAMKHFLWAAWWGNPQAKDWLVRWADGWRAATMAQIDTKLPGFVPLSIWYPSGTIFPPAERTPWYDEKLNYCPRGDMIHDVFLAAYYFTGDRKFLKPFQASMEMASRGPMTSGDHPRGSAEWQLAGMVHFPHNLPTEQNKVALYRWLTGESVYNEYARRFSDPAILYRIDGDLDAYLKSFEDAAKSLRHNLEVQTTEVLSTDRAALGAALSIFGAYTGAITGLRDAATPTFSVTYDTPSTDFAALVTEATRERLRVWLYNFEDQAMPVGLKLWRLRPGRYILSQGEQLPGEHPAQHRYRWRPSASVEVLHRADGPTVTVPPAKVWVVDLRLDTATQVPSRAPDLAVGTRDIEWTEDGLKATVHNIGNANARPFVVALQNKVGRAWRIINERNVASLPAPRDFAPSAVSVTFRLDRGRLKGEYRISVDPRDQHREICESNNVCGPKAN